MISVTAVHASKFVVELEAVRKWVGYVDSGSERSRQ